MTRGIDDGPAFPWRFSSILIVAAAMNPVNSSIIATALVPISEGIGESVGMVALLVTSLYVASAVAQPAMGRYAQRLGPRRVLMAGALLLAAGGVVGALFSSLGPLVAARVLIGIGTSASFPSAMVMIRRRVDETGASPAGVMGGLVAASQITVLVGLPLGGMLVSSAGWRATFWINIPLGLLLFAMGWKWLPRDKATVSRGQGGGLARDLDLPGTAVFSAALIFLVAFLVHLPTVRWTVLIGLSVATVALVAWELRASSPLINVRTLIENRALTATYVRTAGTMVMAYTVMYGLTQWLQESRSLSATAAGLLVVPMSAAGALVSRPASRRGLVRLPLLISAVIGVAVSTALLVVDTSTPVFLIVVLTAVVGVAVGLATVGNQAAVFTQAHVDDTGIAAGLLRTSGYIGAIASGSLIGIVFRGGATDAGMHQVAVVLVGVSALVLASTLFGRKPPRVIGRLE